MIVDDYYDYDGSFDVEDWSEEEEEEENEY